jgi:ubiquitin-conjugating enzyme E2 Z
MSISKETINRLLKDIKQIRNNPLTDNGIYYIHHDSNMLLGYAVLIGPKDTVYFGGYYLFQFEFPYDYPHSPPKVFFCTNGQNIRFHPNYYKNGKVCVSLLNTWRGEQWTSCQTLTSILLTLCSLLNENPLLNEPGVSINHPDVESYNKIIQFYNIDIAICDILLKKENLYTDEFELFESYIIENFISNKEFILQFIKDKMISDDNKLKLRTSLYNMNVEIDYNKLYKKFTKCCNKLKN